MERDHQPEPRTLAEVVYMAVNYHNEGSAYRLTEKRRVSSWVKSVIESEGYHIGDINYIFCSPEYHININRQYLGHDYNTDVITFDYSEPGAPDGGPGIISGDIFIDPETVAGNAEAYGSTKRQEMLRVMIHGVLHLCGYPDGSPSEERQMRDKEDFYLARYQSPAQPL